MKYEDFVRRVCGDDWRTVNDAERHGGYGVACIKAFMRGVRPSAVDLAAHLQVTPDEIATAYNRLNRNGVFSHRWAAKRDTLLQTEDDHAWSHIAAIAGGFVGIA